MFDISLEDTAKISMKRYPIGKTMRLTKHQEETCQLDQKELTCKIISCDKGPKIEVFLDEDNKCYNQFYVHLAFFAGDMIKNMSLDEHKIVA